MINWLHITLLIAFASILVLVFLLTLLRCFHPKTPTNIVVSDTERSHVSRLLQISSKKTNNNYYVLRQGFSTEFFSWADHPSLVADAVENGWSRFAFTTLMSSPSVKSARSICSDHEDGIGNFEIGSGDYMQKIRLNPGLIKKMITTVDSPVSVIRTGLPFPGPRFGNSYFPQETFFEITILPEDINDDLEKVRLENQDGKTEIIWLSVGLTGNGQLPLKIPGSVPGSIGFNSSGSVYLNGTKLVFESENKDEWRQRREKIIGCGYNPGQKKVFFTVDSQLVHEIHCKTEEFGYPLYPTLAANTDIMILVNLGQIPFKFAPGNLQRTPNPCFISPGQPNSPALADNIEDSKDLFSMGRIDSQWLQRSVTRNYNTVNSVRSLEFDHESEGDLFEIVLDSTGRSSPYSTTC